MGTHETHFSATLDGTEAGMDSIATSFRGMDSATSGLVASATTTGMRLASAHRVSTSAKSTLSLLQARSLSPLQLQCPLCVDGNCARLPVCLSGSVRDAELVMWSLQRSASRWRAAHMRHDLLQMLSSAARSRTAAARTRPPTPLTAPLTAARVCSTSGTLAT